MRWNAVTLLVGLCLILSAQLQAAESEARAPSVDLKSSMSVAEFERSGLKKLTAAELEALERWIAAFGQRIAQTVAERARPATPNVIESHIQGEFEGWEGETLFILDNGQIWQQIDYSFMYHYAYRPKVIIVRTSSGWTMTVEGVSKTIRVERLR